MRRLPRLLLLSACALLCRASLASDRLILRNLEILTDRTVTVIDEDGLLLDRALADRGERITWDEIERGKVGLDQAKFDALLADLGPPLYRMRQRLKIGDYRGAGEFAKRLYPRFSERKSQTAYLVCQGTMWSRLASGRREAAVEPYLRSFELLRSKVATSKGLPGARRIKTDAATAMSSELAPIWFDAVAAKAALPEVQKAIRALGNPRPQGAYVYYATLAIAAGDMAEVERVMPLITSGASEAMAWPELVRAMQEFAAGSPGAAVEQLRLNLDALPAACRPVALLVVGQAALVSSDRGIQQEGLLQLLTLPAEYGDDQPELAAAGLYRAAEGLAKLKDEAGAAAVRRELASRYPGSFFGTKQQQAAAR